MTPSEKLLWELLRRKNLSGYRFPRQHPIIYRIDKQWIDFFIADSYSHELSFVIEVDGPVHLKQKEYDHERDSKLSAKGISVLRLKNEELEDKCSLRKKIIENIHALKDKNLIICRIPPFPFFAKGKGQGMG
ncbi:MAG: DUF559 domain-containing protein [Bacteroidales bacterium]|nr:DUF559 domain-containing protein [Bacteroidales bacterium]